MKPLYQNLTGVLLSLAMMVVAPIASAAEKTPQAIVEQATTDMLAIVKKHNAAGKKTDAYYADVQKTLDAVVDFPFIAKAVMRKSAKTATPEQIEKFTTVFKNGLIKTYAKGLANYADSEIKTLPVTMAADATRVSVDQEVSDKGATHKLSYTLRKDNGEWKLINVVLNGVNLGESFTSQFDQAMIKNDKNIDKVIETWLAAN
ncbi:toluene tolerance protein [Cellvibrio zantedeschiae]|uniref:Toluene tolerance protein n=1 Tax=Cellvibrio zantedeschiae TaxID=1237077 RepID=A0ABQ3ATT0_9GAMM|nr:ABC transporter substrate-binding protein [Cellvibrio zantedeschiae]GGY63934.1 toluene tolerance protein [Cellvibrio zantedeschiae]